MDKHRLIRAGLYADIAPDAGFLIDDIRSVNKADRTGRTNFRAGTALVAVSDLIPSGGWKFACDAQC